MAYLALHFCGDTRVELWQSYFAHHLLEKPHICIRGKSTGAFTNNTGSFQWTPAVIALCLLFINHKLTQTICPADSNALVISEKGSVISALNSAIEKAPNWLAEMFGTCSQGELIIKKLIRRSNANFKLLGPMAMSLNPKLIDQDSIDIIFNNKLVTKEVELIRLFQGLIKPLPSSKIPRFSAFLETFDLRSHSSYPMKTFLAQKAR